MTASTYNGSDIPRSTPERRSVLWLARLGILVVVLGFIRLTLLLNEDGVLDDNVPRYGESTYLETNVSLNQTNPTALVTIRSKPSGSAEVSSIDVTWLMGREEVFLRPADLSDAAAAVDGEVRVEGDQLRLYVWLADPETSSDVVFFISSSAADYEVVEVGPAITLETEFNVKVPES